MKRLLHILFLSALVTLWATHEPPAGAVLADPGSILISLAISAAVSAASYGAQRLFGPKPKPLQRGKLSGGLTLQDSAYGLFINEIYGGAPADGKGGVRLSGIVIDASEIRKRTVTTEQETGGKGSPKQKVETTTYYMDLQIMFGRGPLKFKKIWAVDGTGVKVIYDTTVASKTGIITPGFPVEPGYDPFLPPDPKLADTNPGQRYGYVPTPDAQGTIDADIVQGGYAGIRVYEGNNDQLPDPLFEGINNAKYGANSQPAYIGRAYVTFEDYDVSNGVPNFIALVEHKTAKTVGAIVSDRATRAGLQASDLDVTTLNSIECRGFVIDRQQSPRVDMELLGRVFNCDFLEDIDGKVKGVTLSDTIVATVAEDDLGFREGEATQTGEVIPKIEARTKDQSDLPRRLDFTFFNPDHPEFEQATRGAMREATSSRKQETIEVPITLTLAEGQKTVNRELQEEWRESEGYSFTLPHKYAYVRPTEKIKVPHGGKLRQVRAQSVSGTIPGVLRFECVSAEGVLIEVSGGGVATTPTVTANPIPANSVGFFIDLPQLQERQDVPGIIVGAVPRDPTSGEWRSASFYLNKGSDYRHVTTIDTPATAGRAATVLADVPGGWTAGAWDTTNTVDVDFFNNAEPATVTQAQVLDGANIFVFGNEVVGVATWTKVTVGGHPNRWRASTLQRRLKGTGSVESSSHVINERCVQLNSALRYVELDKTEIGVARTWKVATSGQAVSDAAPLSVTWAGKTVESGASTPSAPQNVSVVSANGTAALRWEKPASNANTIDYYEVTVDDNADFSSPLTGYNAVKVYGNEVSLPAENAGLTLHYRVRAHNYFGNGSYATGSYVTGANPLANEDIDDRVNSLITVTGMAKTYDDAANTLNLDATARTQAWTDISAFLNSWVNFGAPFHNAGYYKDRGFVYLRGVIKNGTINTPAFTLPAGYRPAGQVLLVSHSAGPTLARVDVETDGDVVPVSGSTGYITLDGIVFPHA